MAKSPDAFRTISEVAKWLGTQAHVLRFWESKFDQIEPVKRAGGRRYYRPEDMVLIGGIKKLLHEDGMTIKGVQRLLETKGVDHVSAFAPPLEFEDKKRKRKSKAGAKAKATATVAEPTLDAPKTDNVIAFTINPLPKKAAKKKSPLNDPNQPLLFPEITEWSKDEVDLEAAETITPIVRDSTPRPDRVPPPPIEKPAEEILMPLFRSIQVPDVEATPLPLGAHLDIDDKPISAFTAKDAVIAKVLEMSKAQRDAFVAKNRPILIAMAKFASQQYRTNV